MAHFTTETYSLKRDILTFVNKITRHLGKPEKKFMADVTYGMLATGSCILTDVADALHEKTKKINTVERLGRHLAKGTSPKALTAYLATVKRLLPQNPVIHIDDTDIVKDKGYKFEALGLVRDGSESKTGKSVFKKGYFVTEACALLNNGHPVSIYSHIHSSSEKDYVSSNEHTFSAIKRAIKLFGKATFVMDRWYDSNKIFDFLFANGQDFVIRLTGKRKLFLHNKFIMATELMKRRKGKIKLTLNYKGNDHEAYLTHVKTKIMESKNDIFLVLVYGISQHPMMLATNKEIRSKDDVISIAKCYFKRWRIEEYFRAKKQLFKFEKFRVRKLKAINALNFCITVCMAYLANISIKPETNGLKTSIIEKAAPLKEKVMFTYYRIAKGISGILSYARDGVRHWFKTKRPRYRQMTLFYLLI
jgi:hypothetical protein